MRLWLAVALLVAFAAPTHAQVAPEAGIGVAHATARSDGTWWQRAFPHVLGLNEPSPMLGVRYDAGHWTGHLDAIWFGHYTSDAWAIPNDPAYNPKTDTCNGPCLPRAHFIGHGWLGAAKLTFGWHTQGTLQYGVHVGAIRYREQWTLDVPDWYSSVQQSDGTWKVQYRVPVHRSDIRWAFGYTLGASVSYGKWSLNLDYYRDGGGFPGYHDTDPPIWRYHTVLSLVRSF